MIMMKAGDTAPTVRAVLLDADGQPVDLTGATVRFILATKGVNRTIAVDAEAAPGADGAVTYDWAEGDTDQPGEYEAEFEVTYADGRYQTFPTDGYLPARIVDDLGGAV